MLLTRLFEDFYRPLKLRGRPANGNTARLYGCTLRSFSRWLGYPATVDDLTELTISRFLEQRMAVRSPYTAEKERTQLLALARFAVDRRIIEDRPLVPPTVLPERITRAWSVDELQALSRAAAATRGVVGCVPAGVFWHALLSVLWESAERIGAILDVRKDDFQPPYLLVRAESRKGGKRDRVYRLSPETCELVALAMGNPSPVLFWWPGNRNNIWRWMRTIVRRAGLENGRKSGFHQIRRTAASHFAAAGGDASVLLDHSSPRITSRWYLDRRMTERGPAPYEVLPRLA
jgi:integrase